MEEIGLCNARRWAIYIDIQGFSNLWDKEDIAFTALNELMLGIFRVGKIIYPSFPNRLFAHQFGDGFLVVSDSYERSLERCAVIAIALLRHTAATGCFARAAIIEGKMLDINGCYPDEVMQELHNGCISMGEGLMTIIPAMGSALIQGVKLDKMAAKGPLLIVEKEKIDRLPSDLDKTQTIDDGNIVSINWITYQSTLLSDIQNRANLSSPSSADIQISLRQYCKKNQGSLEEWAGNVNRYLIS